jgi:hypothetical protein
LPGIPSLGARLLSTHLLPRRPARYGPIDRAVGLLLRDRRKPRSEMDKMGYLFGQKRQKVGRLQRQAARCFLVMPEADSMELGTWCWPRVVLIEKRPLTECERSSSISTASALPNA